MAQSLYAHNESEQKIKALFIRFLKQQGIYSQYIKNYEYNIKKDNYLADIRDGSNFVVEAFLWTDTREGGSFWSCIHNNWLSILNNNNTNGN